MKYCSQIPPTKIDFGKIGGEGGGAGEEVRDTRQSSLGERVGGKPPSPAPPPSPRWGRAAGATGRKVMSAAWRGGGKLLCAIATSLQKNAFLPNKNQKQKYIYRLA